MKKGLGEVETSILTTKLFIPPVPQELVRRRRLLDKIQAALNHKLTLVSAPAGFGKTTLLSEWIRDNQPPIPTSWLSLEEADNDPRRFWEYFIAALRTLQPDIGEITLELLHASQPMPVESVLTPLINDFTGIQQDSLLVLDDYHFVQSEQVHSGINFLLEHLPPRLHLVIATRADPPLPIAHLRGKGTILEIGADDLRFTAEETGTLLNSLGVPGLSSEDVGALNIRTEGWVVGLKMAILSIRDEKDISKFISRFTGTQRYIMDYLIEEVLKRQSPEIRDFLLKTSVLERLNGPLCDAVTGRHDGQEILTSLEKANLFIVPLDESRQWYRYEHLFAELLRHWLETEFGLEKYNELHRLASDWHEGNGFLEKAIDHALAAQDWGNAIDLVMSNDWQKGVSGVPITYTCNWLRQVPLEVLRTRPKSYVLYAWFLISTGQVKVGADLLDSFEKSEVYDEALEALIAGARMNAALFQRDPRIEDYAKKVRSIESDNIVAQTNVSYQLGVYYATTRRYNEAEPFLSEAYKFHQQQGDTVGVSNTLAWLAFIVFHRGKLHQAEEMLKRALGLTEWAQCTGFQHLLLGLVYLHWNDLEGATDEWEKVAKWEKASLISPLSWVMGRVYLYTSLVCLIKGDTGAAAEALENAERVLVTEDTSPGDLASVAGYHLAIAMEEDDQEAVSRWLDKLAEYDGLFSDMPPGARHLLYERWGEAGRERLQAEYEKYHREGYYYHEIGVRLEQAMLSLDPDEALAFVAEALAMAKPEGNIRILVCTGAPMAPLLRRAIAEGIEPEFARKILRIIESEEHQRKIKKGEPPPAAGLLTVRELEVLHLMADGLSNPQIAERLVISLDTAKTHVHHTLYKLDATSRVQAIARARDLDLL
jgi:LuxR family maltose regulon positive regulatory protein